MANAYATNYPTLALNDTVNILWKLTRVMKAAGWTYKASSHGQQKDTSGTATNDLWGGNASPSADTYTANYTTASGAQTLPVATINVASNSTFPASGTLWIATSTNGWQQVTYTGINGTTQFTGCSGGTGSIASGAQIGSGGITFETSAAWWCAQGPQTVKVPISAAPTGTPIRGETITQATSAAEGELIGYVWDTTANSGWLSILPHTGTFNNTNTITGSISAATFAPTGTVVTYAREVVFHKVVNQQLYASMFYICADISGESAQLFSTLAASAGCTATIQPGGGGTSNAFPSLAISIRGNSATPQSGDTMFGGITGYNQGASAQIGCANATPGTGVSADGSFYVAITTTTANIMTGLMYTRVDDCEPGDLDPYVWVQTQGNVFSSWTRTSNTSYGSSQYLWNSATAGLLQGSYPYFMGYQARGVSGRDVACGYTGGVTYSNIANTFALQSGGNVAFRLVAHPATTPPLIREPLLIYTPGSVPGSIRQYKGRARWISFFPIGSCYDTFDSKTWLAVSNWITSAPVIGIGPYDGSTTPTA